MCAIAGIINTYDDSALGEVQTMCKLMKFRGPDYMDVKMIDNVVLGHSRLAIVDPNTGNQPMNSVDNKVAIVFNGEIYNFQELQDEIIKTYSYQFATKSDTEVIIALFQTVGIEKLLQKLEGMYAFALYDRDTGITYIARDKYGEKPLYYSCSNNVITFASELKAFSPNLSKYSINKKALNYFLALTYILSPYTIYNEISKLQQGHYMIIDKGHVTIREYYNLSEHIKDCNDSFEEAKCNIRKMVKESIRLRMIADVPYGAFLSGGIDSSIVCELMNQESPSQFKTFSIGFDEKEYDESERAEIVAKHINSDHHKAYINYDLLRENIDSIISYYDEPFADTSALACYYVAKLAAKDVKLVLTGDSADEIFAGYEKYLGRYYANRFNRLPFGMKKVVELFVKYCPINHKTNIILRKLRKLISISEQSDFDIYYNLMSLGFKDDDRLKLLLEDYCSIKDDIKVVYDEINTDSVLNREQYCDFHFVLEGCMFPKVDRACMHNSLENRTPFLDSRIVEYSFSINSEYKLKGRNKKYILKSAFADILPDQTLNFKKSGFDVPVDYWFRNELKAELNALLSKEVIEDQGLFDYNYVRRIVDEHISGQVNNGAQLWALFVFQKWYLLNK